MAPTPSAMTSVFACTIRSPNQNTVMKHFNTRAHVGSVMVNSPLVIVNSGVVYSTTSRRQRTRYRTSHASRNTQSGRNTRGDASSSCRYKGTSTGRAGACDTGSGSKQTASLKGRQRCGRPCGDVDRKFSEALSGGASSAGASGVSGSVSTEKPSNTTCRSELCRGSGAAAAATLPPRWFFGRPESGPPTDRSVLTVSVTECRSSVDVGSSLMVSLLLAASLCGGVCPAWWPDESRMRRSRSNILRSSEFCRRSTRRSTLLAHCAHAPASPSPALVWLSPARLPLLSDGGRDCLFGGVRCPRAPVPRAVRATPSPSHSVRFSSSFNAPSDTYELTMLLRRGTNRKLGAFPGDAGALLPPSALSEQLPPSPPPPPPALLPMGSAWEDRVSSERVSVASSVLFLRAPLRDSIVSCSRLHLPATHAMLPCGGCGCRGVLPATPSSPSPLDEVSLLPVCARSASLAQSSLSSSVLPHRVGEGPAKERHSEGMSEPQTQ
eukprot:Rhum_TRINITY_DN25418_c0_g1::Rhum_TRINITY_DN25418_c0_g1_i1::g.182085::m.182085